MKMDNLEEVKELIAQTENEQVEIKQPFDKMITFVIWS